MKIGLKNVRIVGNLKLRKIIKISSKESELHKEYLKNNLKNNYFN